MKKQIMFGLLIAGALTLAACGDATTVSGTGSGGQYVDGLSQLEEAGLITPRTTTASANPYQCPAGTIIRSDCSVASQANCDCMLP